MESRRQRAAGLMWSHCLTITCMRTSYKSTNVTHTQAHLELNKRKWNLHHHFNTHKPCQHLMPRSLPGWYQLSFRDNVSDVSIPFPVPVHSPLWRRYNSLDDRTNDILAPLFSLCLPLKGLIMCNPMPSTTPQAWTIHHCFRQPRGQNFYSSTGLCQPFPPPPTHPSIMVAWTRWCNWSVRSLMPEGCIWESDDPSQLLSAALPLIRNQASNYLYL